MYTRWPEAIPIANITAETVAHAFIQRWISVSGSPATITTDRGWQFESALFVSLTRLLRSTRIRTTSYHPQSNGLVERFHRQLKAAMKAHNDPTHWWEFLPNCLAFVQLVRHRLLSSWIGIWYYPMTTGSVYGAHQQCQHHQSQQLRWATPTTSVTDTNAHVIKNHHTPTAYLVVMTSSIQCQSMVLPYDYRVSLWSTSTMPTPSIPATTLSDSNNICPRHQCACHQEPPYTYRVLSRHDKFYTVSIHGKKENVSIDRLKVAYQDDISDTIVVTTDFFSLSYHCATRQPRHNIHFNTHM